MPEAASSQEDAKDCVSPGDSVGGRYVVEELLGRGGMGIVVAARHETLGQRVAMKLVSGAASAEAFERFGREARIIASLESEHVIRVTDFGMHGAVPFMVMELLSGRDLGREQKLRETIPWTEVVDYLIQACDGLWAAHSKGIVHRDVKPGNLFLTTRPNGERAVKVLDFGVSKLVDSDEGDDALELTRTSTMLGSPLYMSPEQVRDPRTVDERADIWSLGVVLHKLTTGQGPFAGQSASALCAAIAADPPARLREHAPHAPEALEKVILRCLEKSPAARYPSVIALVRDLLPFASPPGRALGMQLLARAEDDAPLEVSADVPAAEAPLEQTAAGVSVVETTERTPPKKRPALWATVAMVAVVGAGSVTALRWPHAAPAAPSLPPEPSSSMTASAPSAGPSSAAAPSAAPSSLADAPSPSAIVLAPSATHGPSPSDAKKRRRVPAPAPALHEKPPARPPGFGGSALDGHD